MRDALLEGRTPCGENSGDASLILSWFGHHVSGVLQCSVTGEAGAGGRGFTSTGRAYLTGYSALWETLLWRPLKVTGSGLSRERLFKQVIWS